ncbi:MAG: tRNA 2-thiouridine(34) synthase MnmA [Pirellulales bacterium]|nr:tRNA 2-thiouridine(34) synthase MnmA [Pirellulales bacterium]
MSRVVLAMSGGVDSSVAAWLLRQACHEVIGIFMRHGGEPLESCTATASCATTSSPPSRSAASGQPPELQAISPAPKQGCCTAADAADARRVADRLEIPLYVLDFEQEFGRIVDYFVSEYAAGRTPNPCVMCNNWLKFGRLFDYAASAGAEYVATGHHARLRALPDGRMGLYRAADAGKDQSYVLFGIAAEALERLLFPVGEYAKSEIRALASRLGLRVADKPDSQEICFVRPGGHADLVRRLRPAERGGEIVTTRGEVVGHHAGLEGFTIGQRKGLGVALGEPRYVVRLEPETRRVVIGTRAELARRELTARDANWLCDPPRQPLRLSVQIRYRSAAVPALVTPLPNNRFSVRFDEEVYGIAPGQAAVCYQADRVLGGGWIE